METGFYIGKLFIRYYGIILMLGAVAAAFLSEYLARRRKLNSEFVWDALIWLLIGGVIGARLWHIFTPPPSMLVLDPSTGELVNPYFAGGTIRILDMLNTRQGGLGIPGAVIGGGLALYLYTRRKKMSFLMWADIAAPAVALGQAIGRWGNFINQELYGAPSDLPWAIKIAPAYRLPEVAQYETFHPLFLYESLWNLANMGLLLWMGSKLTHRLKEGDLLLTYCVVYPVGRFFFEFLRIDAPQIGSLNTNQTAMAIVAVVAAALLIWRHRKPTQPETPAAELAEDAPEGE
ncbi:MAG: prolipoprotein diacylglyceryl transferase [Anaerolineales bacterium]|nr:prolipoprotein diacylglyceryl transferase [Anaerolineales bacterium]